LYIKKHNNKNPFFIFSDIQKSERAKNGGGWGEEIFTREPKAKPRRPPKSRCSNF